MFELKDEETLMYSDDRTVVLTTNRIIHHADSGKQQVMLKDFLNYETKDYYIGNYKILTVIFASITVLILLGKVYDLLWPLEYSSGIIIKILSFMTYGNVMLILSLFLLANSVIHLIISRRVFVRINGKFNSIEFRVTRLKRKSITRFLNRLETQANIIKNEKQNL
ncbi:MAG TPA: hypothetical protein VFI06_07665 [Chitinophagaceae bacterium]|nr:hypothetical protein [Chitinophagaceae bacterium]